MRRPRTTTMSRILVAGALALVPLGCKNSDTLVGPRTPTPAPPTPTLVAPTPAPATPTPIHAPSTPIPMTPNPTLVPVTPAAPSLDGIWTGTVAYLDLDFWEGCDRSAKATFSLNGSTVFGTIQTSCLDAQFLGTLDPSGHLTGTVTLTNLGFVWSGASSGSFGGSHVELTTPVFNTSSSRCTGSACLPFAGFTLSLGR
jgi:hypothetical protein